MSRFDAMLAADAWQEAGHEVTPEFWKRFDDDVFFHTAVILLGHSVAQNKVLTGKIERIRFLAESLAENLGID